MRVERTFEPGDRYEYDFGMCSAAYGFAQVDTSQDASYFGTWANPFSLTIINYCEGDVTKTVCDTPEEFVAELEQMKQWNEENEHRFHGIDPMMVAKLKQKFIEVGAGALLH